MKPVTPGDSYVSKALKTKLASKVKLNLQRTTKSTLQNGRHKKTKRQKDQIINGTACFKKCKQLFEYQHLLLLTDI
jgi:hypothetical protein